MQFQIAFRYLFERSGGFVNLLLITVCQFIPVVGPIVLLGYRAEVSVALDNDPNMLRHPKFDFNRFGEYLSRGVWPFLIALIMSFLSVPIVMGIVLLTLILNPPGQNNAPFLDFAIIAAVELLSIAVLHLLDVPMTFHAEITGKRLSEKFRLETRVLRRSITFM